MSQNLKALSDLRDLQERIISDAEALERDMVEFGDSIEQEVAAVLARTQYTIHGPRKPVTVDSSELPGPSHLPPPLVPQLVAGETLTLQMVAGVTSSLEQETSMQHNETADPLPMSADE